MSVLREEKQSAMCWLQYLQSPCIDITDKSKMNAVCTVLSNNNKTNISAVLSQLENTSTYNQQTHMQ
jgi:hypothetical protein